MGRPLKQLDLPPRIQSESLGRPRNRRRHRRARRQCNRIPPWHIRMIIQQPAGIRAAVREFLHQPSAQENCRLPRRGGREGIFNILMLRRVRNE